LLLLAESIRELRIGMIYLEIPEMLDFWFGAVLQVREKSSLHTVE